MSIEINGEPHPWYQEGASWYKSAAEQGERYSQYDLAGLYESGMGVLRDRVEALKWYYLAAANGIAEARSRADRLESLLTHNQAAEAEFRAKNFRRSGANRTDDAPTINGETSSQKSTGSGFFITRDGFVISNEHVVRGGKKIELSTKAGTIHAKVIRVDSANDLALLKTDGVFCPLPIASSRQIKVGSSVATIGFPNILLQALSPKFAKGEVAALSGPQDDPKFFQISVPLQPGNSGGPLLDQRGAVIGVVSAKLNLEVALKFTGTIAENVNYAIKSSFVLGFLEAVPEVLDKLEKPPLTQRSFDDIVIDAQKASTLVLVSGEEH